MRLKKLMSLVLACVFALSLVTVANAANDVLFYEDFSSYVATEGTTAREAFLSNVTHKRNQSWAVTVLEEGIAPGYYDRNNANYLDGDFAQNQAGSKAYKPYVKDGTKYDFYYLFPQGWDLAAEANANKTVVYSYELDYGPNATVTGDESFSQLLWATPTKEGGVEMGVIGLDAPVDGNRQLNIYTRAAGVKNNQYLTNFAHSTTHNVAVGVSRGTDITSTGSDAYKQMFKKTFGINGSGAFDKDGDTNVGTIVETFFKSGQTALYGFRFNARFDSELKIANIKIYTIDTDSFAVSASKTTDLGENETITFNFTNPVSEAAFKANKSGITVKKGEENFTGFEVGNLVTTVANGQVNSSVAITFEGLEAENTYTVEFPAGITNEIAQPLNNSTVTLATKVPELVSNFVVVKNWGTAGETTDTAFTAEATLQGGKLEITNNTDADKDVAVIYAVYSHNGQLKDVVYVNDKLAQKSTSEIEAGVTLSTDLTEGSSKGYVKAFIWNTIDALTPYLGATECDIEVAQQ